MKRLWLIRYLISLILLFLPRYLLSVQRAVTLAIVDTVGREAALFLPAIECAHAAGIHVDYIGLDVAMDEDHLDARFKSYDGIVVNCGVEFLKGIFSLSPVARKMLQSIRAIAREKGKLVALALPPLPAKQPRNIVSDLAPLFNAIGIDMPSKQHARLHHKVYLSQAINQFFASSFELKPRSYHTTLHMPSEGNTTFAEMSWKLQPRNIKVNVFPSHDAGYPTLVQTMPYGICWKNSQYHNYLMLTKASLWSFSSIVENFHVCPASFEKRQHMLQGFSSMLHDIKLVLNSSHPKTTISCEGNSEQENKFGKPLLAKNSKALRKTAWMEIPLFSPKAYDAKVPLAQQHKENRERAIKQDALISYILDASLDAVWISLTPNIYYSTIAKHADQEKQFSSGLSCFTKKLQTACQQRGVTPPLLLVGFEIADNLYAPHLPQNFAVDVYGNTYEDVPCPLDTTFWEQEVKVPLRSFLQKWQDPKISHGLKIGGVLLDLEMYCRKKTGTFLTTMGFEKTMLQKFFVHRGIIERPETVHKAVQFLMQEKLVRNYFLFLEQEAKKLGENLRSFFDEQIPGGVIGCYTPMIMIDWFYKGLGQALSAASRPMQLFTFNAEFNAHRHWFEKNNIYVCHSSVLLLSKIRATKNFSWVAEILKRHNGIWFNRFSRLVEDYDAKSWTAIEQTPLPDDKKKEFLDYLDKV